MARRSAGYQVTTATLVASVIGAWVLFSPAEAGTWAGLAALVGYGIGQAAPLFAFVFLGTPDAARHARRPLADRVRLAPVRPGHVRRSRWP